MCGITGVLALSPAGKSILPKITDSVDTLIQRGPDGEGIYRSDLISIGHRRLSIIDTSSDGAQPMKDASGRYVIVFNGEIFNFKELRSKYLTDDSDWQSDTDTEVLLRLWIRFKEESLQLLRGFFAFAIYDSLSEKLFLARDRYGKKPLYIAHKADYLLAFGSSLSAILAYVSNRVLDPISLRQYLHFNYIPEPWSIFQGIEKLPPGHYLTVEKANVTIKQWYRQPSIHNESVPDYPEACETLRRLLSESVSDRLVSDVPLGAFLSGGIDSSVVVALASQLTDTRLRTFSIGYKDHPFFDETSYAIEVAKKFNVDHTVFSLTNDDFLQHLEDVLNSIDEPFADSSAIPLFILSKHTRRQVTVALSGDGGDEIFAGYNKHAAEYRLRIPSWKNELVRFGGPLWAALPKSRNSRIGNLVRQLDRFSKGAALNPKERYWQWAGFLSDSELSAFLKENPVGWEKAYGSRKDSILAGITGGEQMEDFLATDMSLVLLSDMLVKVDRMSMANSLEVRSPFLDHRVVEYAFSLPTRYKLGGGLKKRIVQDAFRSILPESLYNRPKKGFEIPLLDWFRKELRSRIQDEWLADRFVEEQGIFNVEATRKLKARLFSADPGDAHATVWALIVFQQWWKRTMSSFNHSSTGIE